MSAENGMIEKSERRAAMAMMFVDLSRERWNASVFDDWVIDAFVCMCNCISLAEMDNHMELVSKGRN